MTVKRYIITADDVVDNLTSTDTSVPLSAKQGKVLADRATILEGKTANATTSSKGIVQVGSGLSVTDGVISAIGGGKIDYSYTAGVTDGFKVGWQNYSTDPYVTSASTEIGAGETLLFSHIKIIKTRNAYPFVNICSAPPFDTHFRVSWSVSMGTYRDYSGKIVKDSDGSILWSGTTKNNTEMSFPLTNWNFNTDTFSVYASGAAGARSTVSINRAQTALIIPYVESQIE